MNPYYPTLPVFDPTYDFNKCTLTTNLYVEDIDKQIRRETLENFFSKYGPLHEVKYCKSASIPKDPNRYSAVVKFIYRKDAESALKQAQYEKLGRYHIIITHALTSGARNAILKLTIGNIDPNVNAKDLHAHFTQSKANIICVKIETDGEGRSLGSGHILFETREHYNYALCRLQGTKLKDQELKLARCASKNNDIEALDKTLLYVKHFPPGKNKADLYEIADQIFSRYGEISSVSVHKHAKEDKYYAIVAYKDHSAAKKALDDLANNLIDYGSPEGPLFVNWHQNKSERVSELKSLHQNTEAEKRVYLKNLRETITDQDLIRGFKRFGTVTGCDSWTSTDIKKRSRCAVISYNDDEEANKACLEALEYPEIRDLYLRNYQPYVNLYQSKEEREKCVNIRKECKAQIMYMELMNNMYEADSVAFQKMMRQQKPLPVGIFSPLFINQQNNSPITSESRKKSSKGEFNNEVDKENMNVNLQVKTEIEKAGQFQEIEDIMTNLSGFLQLQAQEQAEILKKILPPLIKKAMGRSCAYQVVEMITDFGKYKVSEILEWAKDKTALVKKVNEISEIIEKNKVTMDEASNTRCGIDVNRLKQLHVDKQKEILGKLLFGLIREVTGDGKAPRVTGMLINQPVFKVEDILSIIEEKALLERRIGEAIEKIEEENLLKEAVEC